jgi:hypothetical protein
MQSLKLYSVMSLETAFLNPVVLARNENDACAYNVNLLVRWDGLRPMYD